MSRLRMGVHIRRPLLLVLLLVIGLMAGLTSPCPAQETGVDNSLFRDMPDADTGGSESFASGFGGGQISFWGPFLKMLAALALVLGLIVFAAWLMRRLAPNAMGGQGRADAIRIVATRMLGGRRSLLLVRVRGQTLLLGVTPQSIQCLSEIQEIESEWAQPLDDASPRADASFEKQLNRILDQTRSDTNI